MKKILKFFSPTCGPCKIMSKNIEEALKSLNDVELQDIDITEPSNEVLIEKYKPTTVPTLIILDKEDNIIEKLRGIHSVDKIIEVCQEQLNI